MKIIKMYFPDEIENPTVLWEGISVESKWLGAIALKNPTDAWLYQEIIYKIKPDFILEAGSNEGGGTLFLASMLDLCRIDGQVYSIDIESRVKMPHHPKIKWIRGNSADPEVIKLVVSAAEGKRGLVILDSDHNSEHVLKEMRGYWPIVAKDSYLIVEDTYLNPGNGGPYDAVERFLKENEKFEVDKSMNRHMTTYNPNGFLRRK